MIAVVGMVAAPAMAGVVTAFVSVSGPGLDSMSFNNLGTPDPENDDVTEISPNWIAVNQKAYNAVGYIDMVFAVADSGSIDTEYIFTEGVHNGTGVVWTDYHLELGFGVGAGFVQSVPGDGLDFDSPNLNSPFEFFPFTSLTITEDTVDALGGNFLPGNFHVIVFPIDIPNGITEFTVRQWPTIAPIGVQESTWGKTKALYREQPK
jgi:hypothetical protein